MTKQEKYQQYKDNHICPQCKLPWLGKQVMCDSCRSKAEERRKKRTQERQAVDICGRCGKDKVIPGTKYCVECAEKAKKHKDSEETKKKRLIKYHQVYKPILQAQRIKFKEEGKCADCGMMPPKFGVVCKGCYAKRRHWYERQKVRQVNAGLLSKCNGDCVNCMLPWCVDDDDVVTVKLTSEEKKLSRELDKEARAEDKRLKAIENKDLRNAKNRYSYAYNIIADIESRREMGEEISPAEEKKLANAEKRAIEAYSYIESHTSDCSYLPDLSCII